MLNHSRGRARIGVLVPFTNTNLESDMIMARPMGVSLHFSRIGGYDLDAVPDANQMAGFGKAPLDEPLRLLAGCRPDVVVYGCTSATLTHGVVFDRELVKKIKEDTGAETVTAAGSLLHALRFLGINAVAFASPYVGQINDMAEAFLASAGVQTVSRADIGKELGNYGQGALTPDEVFQLACRADSSDAQAMVLSCTDMRSMETINRLEAELGKPVVTSNQAMLFQALQILGIETHVHGFGHLFSKALAAE